MTKVLNLVGLDVGEKRIGVAISSNNVRIASPLETIEVDGNEIKSIEDLVKKEDISIIVIGYPRNQSGEATKQTQYIKDFAKKLNYLSVSIVFQDESMTSVLAEERLKNQNKPYEKKDIDAMAATIILQDYIEANYG
ncbi:MAG: Holliday junction resolvase RuvX [Candidatus Saccharimonadales bacterium]